MDVLVWLVLVSVISLDARRVARRNTRKSDDLSDQDILEVLSDIILESEGIRKGRQNSDVELVTGKKQSADQRSIRGGFVPGERCELIGFEFTNKTECNEIFEIECGPANVTKFRTELVDKCRTVIDKKCNLRMIEVPERKCQERLQNKYDYSLQVWFSNVTLPLIRAMCIVFQLMAKCVRIHYFIFI